MITHGFKAPVEYGNSHWESGTADCVAECCHQYKRYLRSIQGSLLCDIYIYRLHSSILIWNFLFLPAYLHIYCICPFLSQFCLQAPRTSKDRSGPTAAWISQHDSPSCSSFWPVPQEVFGLLGHLYLSIEAWGFLSPHVSTLWFIIIYNHDSRTVVPVCTWGLPKSPGSFV